MIEVFGPLKEGDTLVRRAIDEIRDGSKTIAFYLGILPTRVLGRAAASISTIF